MPHTATSKQRATEKAARMFMGDLLKKITSEPGENDMNTYDTFCCTLSKLRYNSTSNEDVAAQVNSRLSKYPEFCNRVTGFHPNGTLMLKDTEPLHMDIPVTPPSHFTADTLPCIAVFLPYPSLGRLAKTCKWMNANITQTQVENTIKRAAERLGKIELLTEPSRKMVRVFSADEDMLEVGKTHPQSFVYIIRMNGRTFLGSDERFIASTTLSVMLDYTIDAYATNPDKPLLWFKHCLTDDILSMQFVMILGENKCAASLQFQEFIP